jgi:ABC-type amino acid transport substrate-binding protein
MLRRASQGLGRRTWQASLVVASLAVPAAIAAQAKPAAKKTPATAETREAGTLARVKETGVIRLGYRTNARPFSFKDEGGMPAGYSVDLCQRIPEAVKQQLNLTSLKVDWVPVAVEDQLTAVKEHQVDVLCGSMSMTLGRRKDVDFSIPIFPGGVGVVTRTDAPHELRNILAGKAQDYTPKWRAVALNILREQIFGIIPGTTAEEWAKRRAKELDVRSRLDPVQSYQDGVQAVLDRKVSAFFGERAILLDAASHNPSSKKLLVIDRLFTYEPLALALERTDDDFRLLVDQTLSQLYGTKEFVDAYTKWFAEPDQTAMDFFRWNTLPQ